MLKSVDHVNIVVNDVSLMLGFYRDALGLKVTQDVVISGDWIAAIVGLENVKARVIYLEVGQGAGTRIELIKYESPISLQPADQDKPHAIGIRHMAFAVDDIDVIVERLENRGVTFSSQVMQVPNTQVQYAGNIRKRLVYFHDPEGNILELCEYHAGE